MIQFTDRAVLQARMYQDTHAQARGKMLRVWIADKNCDGFQYGVAFDDAQEGDHELHFGSLTVLVDPGTAQYIGGAEVDYVEDERGKGFLVQHPEADKFRGKFFLKTS